MGADGRRETNMINIKIFDSWTGAGRRTCGRRGEKKNIAERKNVTRQARGRSTMAPMPETVTSSSVTLPRRPARRSCWGRQAKQTRLSTHTRNRAPAGPRELMNALSSELIFYQDLLPEKAIKGGRGANTHHVSPGSSKNTQTRSKLPHRILWTTCRSMPFPGCYGTIAPCSSS